MALSKISVSELKQLHFSTLPLEKKIEIKLLRPTPRLNLVQVTKSKNREFKREFKPEFYDKHSWICGCDLTARLFCFPCLLFAKQSGDSSWVNYGVADLSHLTQKIKKHECAQSHLNSILEFNLLGKVDIRQQLDSAFRLNIKRHNEQVTKNRYVLSKIINCVLFCGAFELALRGHDERDDSLNPGVFRGLINFSAELDTSLKDHLTSATVFKGTSKEIQNDLLGCMLTVCQNHIKNEIAKANFVSVISDETTDVSSASQLVLVFRYVLSNGQPVERFWEFINPLRHDAQSLAGCIHATLEKVVDSPDKVISQSYDGTNVMSGHRSGVQAIIQRTYKNAHFVHCYAHQLNLIVGQATSQNQQIRVFFSNLSDITNFFSNSPQRIAILDETVGKRIPHGSATRWNFKSRTINTVFEYRDELMKCVEKIESSSKQAIVINQAGAIRRMLEESVFVFWLTVFHNIMPHVEVLYNQLQKTSTDAAQIRKHVNTFQQSIEKERETMDTVIMKIPETEQPRKRKTENIHINRTVAAKEVCDIIATQMKERFSFVTHYTAVSLLEAEKFQEYEKKFPTQLFEQTTDVYPILEKGRLKTELGVIYRRPDFRNMSGTVSLLQFVVENNLQTTFSETYKLLQIISTIPMTTAEAERCFSTLKRVKTFLRSTMSEDRLSALAMLSIEKNMINNIPEFNESVIDLFASKKNRRVDLILKTCT